MKKHQAAYLLKRVSDLSQYPARYIMFPDIGMFMWFSRHPRAAPRIPTTAAFVPRYQGLAPGKHAKGVPEGQHTNQQQETW